MSVLPPNIRWVDQNGFLTREAVFFLNSINQASTEQWVSATLTTSAVSYYSLSADVTGEVTAASAVNTTASSIAVDVWVVPASSSPGPTNQVIATYAIPAGASASLAGLVNQAIPPGASIYASCDTAAACLLTVSGIRR